MDTTLDCPVTHEFAKRLGMEQYALIETDYFGGAGTQRAAVHRGPEIEVEATEGAINAALKLLGVTREYGDEFDAIGLRVHRSFDQHFRKYWRS